MTAKDSTTRAALDLRARDAAKEIPSFLYRYRSCNTPYFEEEIKSLILDNEAYFPSRIQLNDPLDSFPIIEKGVDFKEFSDTIVPLFSWILNETNKEFVLQGQLGDEKRETLNAFMKNLPLAYRKRLFDGGLEKYIKGKLLDEIGVLSLTDSSDNMVMWSTYASRTNGVCVALEGYNMGIFGLTPTKVEYVEERPRLNYWGFICFLLAGDPTLVPRVPEQYQQHLLDHKHQMKSYDQKHVIWSYENEFRLVKFHFGGRYNSLHPGKVREIYIGQQVTHGTRAMIIEAARNNGVNVYDANIRNDGYGFTFMKIV